MENINLDDIKALLEAINENVKELNDTIKDREKRMMERSTNRDRGGRSFGGRSGGRDFQPRGDRGGFGGKSRGSWEDRKDRGGDRNDRGNKF